MSVKRAVIWVAVSSRAQAADDKVSLADQEKLTRAVCERSGWQIVDVLRVPGHSRNYIDINECAADMRAVGIDAFDKLMEHWQRRDFDVLVVYDANRFARTQTLTSYVVEMTILQGATLYAINGGEVKGDNFRMWISMTGYKSASEIDTLKHRRSMAIDDFAARGLPTGPRVPWVFERVRDPKTGKTTGLQLSEGMRPLIDTAARLIVEGVSWPKLPGALRECGFTEPDGKLIGIGKLQRLFYHPALWGNSAARYSKRADNSESSDYVRLWALGPEYPAPPNALIYYNMTPPYFDGAFGAALKAELIRRTHIRGATRPNDTPFCSGLVVCGECGMRMTVQTVHRGGRYMRCLRPFQKHYTAGRDCNHRTHYRFDKIRAFMVEVMRPYTSTAVPLNSHDTPITIDPTQRDEIERLTAQRSRLIRLQAEAPDDETANAYSDEVAQLGKRIRTLRRDADRADAIHIGRLAELESQRQTHAAIREMGPEQFWSLPDRVLNQWLRRAFGAAYVEAHNGELTLITP
jgi:DNA invertase Pin-like site-specific DNA recombinase